MNLLFSLALGTAVLLLDLLKLLLGGLLGGVPALMGHLIVDAALHGDSVVQRGVEGLMHIGCGRLNGAVHIQVADTLGGQEYALHNFLVVHALSSLNKIVEAVENLLVFGDKPLGLLAQLRNSKLLCGLLALMGHKLSVAQCVLDIEKFLVCHLPLVLSKFFITFGKF